MNDTVLSTTQTEAQVMIMVFSVSVILLYDDMNTLTSSPELQSSFHQLLTEIHYYCKTDKTILSVEAAS